MLLGGKADRWEAHRAATGVLAQLRELQKDFDSGGVWQREDNRDIKTRAKARLFVNQRRCKTQPLHDRPA